MKLSDIVIVDGVRTAIGTFGGSLSSLSPAELGTVAATEAIRRSGTPAEAIDHAVKRRSYFAHLVHTFDRYGHIERIFRHASGRSPKNS